MFEDYESPINLFIGEIHTQMEEDMVKAVQAYDINVNKDELVKALSYDRAQYQKGYINGFNDAKKHSKWIKSEYGDDVCENCGNFGDIHEKFPYCPWCGCQMDLE